MKKKDLGLRCPVVRGRMVMDIFLQYCSVSVVDVPAANRK
jgi:hypothetical protein